MGVIKGEEDTEEEALDTIAEANEGLEEDQEEH